MSGQYQKIAVAIDFSELSLKAFERAINVANHYGATLLLVHVVDTKSFGSITAYDLDFAGKLVKESNMKLEELKSKAEQAGVSKVDVVVKEGSSKEVLIELLDVDLIVCGAMGTNQIEKMLIGSVAERIAQFAPCEVLIVR
ncbi:universal stress protein [Lysinibacillus halotolerans]|uniref:Universal stress protein n=1 Tax=Lysinibacillus halotolerans TaxID=1368476 RepID=A0A3M8HBC6_9BACI|nr:universal stress protein [Lysinibacillus halotolerans]RNC99682.1 universal stress protein [Lysinibacillus halotolerans]